MKPIGYIWLAADDTVYDLSKRYRDRVGDLWELNPDIGSMAAPMLRAVGSGHSYSINSVILSHGPLEPVDDDEEEITMAKKTRMHYILSMELVPPEKSGVQGRSTQYGYFTGYDTEDAAFMSIWRSCCKLATEKTTVGPWTTENTCVVFYRLVDAE